MSYGNQHFTNSHHVVPNGQQYNQPEQNRMNIGQNQMSSQFGSNNFRHPYPSAATPSNPMAQNFLNQRNNQMMDNSRLHHQTSHAHNTNTAVPPQYHQGYTPSASEHYHHNNNLNRQNNIMDKSETVNHNHSSKRNESTVNLQNQNMNGSQTVNAINSYSGNTAVAPLPTTIRHTEPLPHVNGTWYPPPQTTEVPTNDTQQKQTEPRVVASIDASTEDNKKRNSRPEIQSGQNEIVKVVPLSSHQYPNLISDSSEGNDQGSEGSQASNNGRSQQNQNVQITVTSLSHTAIHGAHRTNIVQRGPSEMPKLQQQNKSYRSNNLESHNQSAQQAIVQPSNGSNANFDRTHHHQSHAIHSGHAAVKPAEPAPYRLTHSSDNPGQNQNGFLVQPVRTRRNFVDNLGVDNSQTLSHPFSGTSQQSNGGNRSGVNQTSFPSNHAPNPEIKHNDYRSAHMPGGIPIRENDQRGVPNNDHNWKQPNPHQQMANHGVNHARTHNQQAQEQMQHFRQQRVSQNMMMMQKEEQQRNAFNAASSSQAPINGSTALDPHLAEQRRQKAIYEEHLRSIPSEPPMLQVGINNMGGMTGRVNNNLTNWTAHFSQQSDRIEPRHRFSPYNKDSSTSDYSQRRPSPSANVFNRDSQPITSANGRMNGQAVTSQEQTFSSTQEYLTYLNQQAEEGRRQRMLTPLPMNTEQQASKNDEDGEIEFLFEKKGLPLSADSIAQQQHHNALGAFQNNGLNFNQFPNAMNSEQQALQQQHQHQQLHANGAYGNGNQYQNPNQNHLMPQQHLNVPQAAVQYQQPFGMQKVEPALLNLQF
ncbi:hypothetical protein CAEBREN_12127 [Caenorhabditis brenneri]|uniref:Uncharacterized protein n=1 Tax=Caenorhabditis brenneri TaxID=135651 RepID=G0MI28_CAEBE|nr:hypothetical protein CAEBREN_12127 [Caenorhabditis brenneri]